MAKFYLDPANRGLGTEQPKGAAILSYQTSSDGLTFLMPPMTADLEITGPVAAKLFVSSDTRDADLFLVLRWFDHAGKEVVFIGSNDPATPVGLGWLRGLARSSIPQRTLPMAPPPNRPWPPRPRRQRLTRGVPVELDIEIWRPAIVVPPGYRVGPHRARQGIMNTMARTQRCPCDLCDERRSALSPTPMPRRPSARHFGGVKHAAFSETGKRRIHACFAVYSIEGR